MDMEASIATFLPNRVFISCSLIALGACSWSKAVRPLIPMVVTKVVGHSVTTVIALNVT